MEVEWVELPGAISFLFISICFFRQCQYLLPVRAIGVCRGLALKQRTSVLCLVSECLAPSDWSVSLVFIKVFVCFVYLVRSVQGRECY